MSPPHCLLYYQKMKTLFPDIEYKEGRFLRDMKMQLREYSALYPDATYEEVEENFGKVEDVVYDYIEASGVNVIYESAQRRRRKKMAFYLFLVAIISSVLAYTAFFYMSYAEFSENQLQTDEIIIEGGTITYE